MARLGQPGLGHCRGVARLRGITVLARGPSCRHCRCRLHHWRPIQTRSCCCFCWLFDLDRVRHRSHSRHRQRPDQQESRRDACARLGSSPVCLCRPYQAWVWHDHHGQELEAGVSAVTTSLPTSCRRHGDGGGRGRRPGVANARCVGHPASRARRCRPSQHGAWRRTHQSRTRSRSLGRRTSQVAGVTPGHEGSGTAPRRP